jgi:hypothetical protein
VESEATPLELFGGQAFVQRVDLRALRVALEREALVKPREKRVLEAAVAPVLRKLTPAEVGFPKIADCRR